ncbi:MAG: ParB/RepB/Spo0J family partition protein [Solirubrobacteraceae bacterium]
MSKRLSTVSLVGLEELTAPGRTVERDTPRDLDPRAIASSRRASYVGEQLVVNLPLDSITPNTHQPRRTFDPKAIDELAASIKQHGRVLQPVLVRPAAGGEDSTIRFELVTGERRWRASRAAGLDGIRAIIEGVDDATSAEMALVENMARDDLSPIDEARGCAALRDSFGMSIAEIARRVGRDRSAISHLIRLLDLPDPIQELLAAETLSEGHGRVLLRVEDFRTQERVGARCAQEGWSVRAFERQVDALLNDDNKRPVTTANADQAERVHQLAEQLEPVFGINVVKIVPRRHGSYHIQVQCADLDRLTSIVEQLRVSTTS